METKELVKGICNALDDKKAHDVKVIDIKEISTIGDYFIVASADNQNQLNAMQRAVDEYMYTNKIDAKSIEGNRQSTWILMDYEDIIVHLFSEEDRVFYNLERIWQDGKIMDANDL